MKKHKDKEVRTRVTEEFRNKYLSYCKKNNFVFSVRLRVLMEKDMDGQIK